MDNSPCASTRNSGCFKKKHGHSPATSPTYRTWAGMIARCHRPYATDFDLYGGRGISVCAEWRGEHGFENFLRDMGERPPGLTLDRRERNGNYTKDNCRWSDAATQANNRRSTIRLVVDGVERSFPEHCKIYGIDRGVAWKRRYYGWDTQRIFHEKTHSRP